MPPCRFFNWLKLTSCINDSGKWSCSYVRGQEQSETAHTPALATPPFAICHRAPLSLYPFISYSHYL